MIRDQVPNHVWEQCGDNVPGSQLPSMLLGQLLELLVANIEHMSRYWWNDPGSEISGVAVAIVPIVTHAQDHEQDTRDTRRAMSRTDDGQQSIQEPEYEQQQHGHQGYEIPVGHPAVC